MASFNEHVVQAKKNLLIFKEISDKSNYFDWQVTICYYTAVHLIHAHIAKKTNMHYRNHHDTKNAISPDNQMSFCPFDATEFDIYVSLENLSRQARYMCDIGVNINDTYAHYIQERHVSKAIKRLNTLMMYFNNIYGTDFEKIKVICPNVNQSLSRTLKFFEASPSI